MRKNQKVLRLTQNFRYIIYNFFSNIFSIRSILVFKTGSLIIHNYKQT